jgi:adenylate/guanylate cyclase family protein
MASVRAGTYLRRDVARNDLPTGTVTFLFTDIEGSTKLLHELGPAAYAGALAEHRQVLRDAFARHAGIEVDTQGDAFSVAFPNAPGAVSAAADAQESLASGPIRVRMGLHTAEPLLTGERKIHTGLAKWRRTSQPRERLARSRGASRDTIRHWRTVWMLHVPRKKSTLVLWGNRASPAVSTSGPSPTPGAPDARR